MTLYRAHPPLGLTRRSAYQSAVWVWAGATRRSALQRSSPDSTGEFGLVAFRGRRGACTISPRSLTDDLLLRLNAFLYGGATHASPFFCGPGGVRTLGLLNAIEARSQLRYGPKLTKC